MYADEALAVGSFLACVACSHALNRQRHKRQIIHDSRFQPSVGERWRLKMTLATKKRHERLQNRRKNTRGMVVVMIMMIIIIIIILGTVMEGKAESRKRGFTMCPNTSPPRTKLTKATTTSTNS